MKHTLLIFILLLFSFVVRAAPSIQIWQPANNAVLEPNFWTTLSSGASDTVSVTYFVNNIHYCQTSTYPYNCGWFTPPSGTHSIRAVARSASGAEVSQTISVSIRGAVTTSPSPEVSLWQPQNGTTFQPGFWTTLSAGATKAASVTWYVNGAHYCVSYSSPYNCGWQAPSAAGSYTIKAVARNASGQSDEKSVTVSVSAPVPPPTISLWQPASGSVLTPNTWTTLSSGASNAASVTYYVNGNQHCVVNAAPYNCGWKTPASSGTVTVKVVAANSDGVKAEQSVSVTITGSTAPAPTPTPTPEPTPTPTSPDLLAGTPYLYALPALTGYQGKPLNVSYRFAGKSISEDLIVFVYFQDMNGKTLIQDDFRPEQGSSTWNGDVVFNRSVDIPSNFLKGTYKIIAGFYRNADGWPKVSATPGSGVTTLVPNTVFQIGFLTLPNDPPPIPPTISLTFPVNNMVLLNNTPMNFTAASDKAVRIDMYVNGSLICSDSSAPFSCPYTTPNADSSLRVMAVATGPTNLSSTSEISVKVSATAPMLQAPGPQVPAGYTLYFNDEFENRHNGAPNPNYWDYTIDYVINNESQCYTDNRRENVRVEHRSTEGYTNGYLVLQLRKEQFPCKQDSNKTYQYTSGSVMTRKRGWGPHLVDMPHGRYEIRAKIPSGRGTWPAIWLLGDSSLGAWPNSGEIDIMEAVGYEEAKGLYRSHSTLHRNPNVGLWPNKWGTTGQGHSYYHNVPLSNDFHVWAMEWTPDTITFYFDGKIVDKRVVVGDRIEYHDSFIRSEFEGSGTPLGWPFSRETPGHQFKLMLNLAWGGSWGGLEGIDDSIFSRGDVEMVVDYVRVYKKN